MTTMRAVGYTRVSTERQATEEKVSLEQQRAEIESHCAAKGYRITGWYSDVGSGASKRRPEFQRMLRDIQAGVVEVVVCWKSDRLSRGTFPATALIEAIEGTDVALESVKDTIDVDTFELFAWVGKRELKAISERARMGMRGKVMRGTLAGHAKFGYRLEGPKGQKRPVVDEQEAATVQRIFSEYVNGTGCHTVAMNLRRDGILTRFGKIWDSSAVWNVIRDPVYSGKTHYGRKQFFKRDNGERYVRHSKAMPKETWISVEYPRIIDEWTWRKTQEARVHPMRKRAKTKFPDVHYMLKGLLWCGECGKRYTTGTSTQYSYYVRKDGSRGRYATRRPRRRYACMNGYGKGGGGAPSVP